MAKKLTIRKTPEKANLTGGRNDSELLQLNKELKEEIQTLKEQSFELWDPELLPTRSPFKDLFPIQVGTLSDIVDDMKTRGFDPDYPVLLGVFSDGFAVVDGHTRTAGAINAGIEVIPVIKREFSSDREALDYAIHLQKDRRNITDAELYSYIHAVDETKQKGRVSGTEEPVYKGRSADRTAELTGTSPNKVKKARAIEKNGSAELKEEVRTGRKTINAAYTEIREQKKEKLTDNCAIPQLPKVSIPGATLLKIISDLEAEIIAMEDNYLFNYGRFIGIYNLILEVLPVGKITELKWAHIGIPLLQSYSRIQEDAKRRENEDNIDENIGDIVVELKGGV